MENVMPLDLVIFDCDGVLIDSEGLAMRVFVETLATYGICLTLEEAMKRYMGTSLASEMADIEARYRIKLAPDYAEKKRRKRMQLFETSLKAMPGILGLIDALSYKKCVASSGSPQTLHHSLGLVGLWDAFAPHIFSATQVKNGKPAPDLFLFAADQMGVSASNCLVVEDSVAGVQAAKAAKMRVFGFTGGEHCGPEHAEILRREGADQVFASMNQIAEALGLC